MVSVISHGYSHPVISIRTVTDDDRAFQNIVWGVDISTENGEAVLKFSHIAPVDPIIMYCELMPLASEAIVIKLELPELVPPADPRARLAIGGTAAASESDVNDVTYVLSRTFVGAIPTTRPICKNLVNKLLALVLTAPNNPRNVYPAGIVGLLLLVLRSPDTDVPL
jgi:hypothetical protein